jgi:Tol biopolymer transport system component
VYRVSSVGGNATPVTSLNASNHETSHFWPPFLPDGRHFLFTAWAEEASNRGIFVGDLDSKEIKRVSTTPSMAVYASGYLFYRRGGTLVAQSFNVKSATLTGEPIPIAEQILFTGANGRAAFAVSETGTVIYRSGAAATKQRFAWFDRSGKEVGSVGEPGAFTGNFALSPDAKQLAVSIVEANRSDLWVMDLSSGVTSRFTHDDLGSASGRDVVWSPDGLQLAYTTHIKGNQDISMKKASGVGQEELLVGSPNAEFVEDWSADGKYIVYGAWAPTPTDIWVMPLMGDRKPFPVVQSPFRKDEPHFSFDGKWLAYASEESGRWEVQVISFPKGDQKRQVSSNGGSQPRWRRDGKELYYLALNGQLMAVDITTGSTISSGPPRALFDTGLMVEPTIDQYAVTQNGQRFLILKPLGTAAPNPIGVIVNWKPPSKS